ncbi:MAG: hypothetical protein AAGF23_05680 [Acidobacteriota bacterium]
MKREPMDRFDDALKAWAGKPPRRTPRDAARDVLRRLPDGPRRRPSPPRRRVWAWTGANVAAAAALVAIVGLRFAPAPYPTSVASAPRALEAPPLPEDVILMWLDSETPLYLSVPSSPAPSPTTPRLEDPTPRPAEGAPTP